MVRLPFAQIDRHSHLIPYSNPDSMGFVWCAVAWVKSCDWNAAIAPLSHTLIFSLTRPLLKWLQQSNIFHKRNSSSYRVQGASRISGIYAQIPLQAFYSVLPRIVAITLNTLQSGSTASFRLK